MQTWIDNGAKLAWLVDPIAKNIAIYRPNLPIETLEQPDTVMAEAPVAGFELRCAPALVQELTICLRVQL